MEKESKTNAVIDTVKEISKGNLPTNEQLSGVSEKAQEFIKEKQHDVTVPHETRKVLSAAQEVVEAAQQLVENKNADEHIQKLAKASAEATKEATEGMDTEKLKEKLQQVDEHGELQAKGQQLAQESKRAGQAALGVLQTMIKSGEFRTWILDFVGLMHDVILKSSVQKPGAPTTTTTSGTKQTQPSNYSWSDVTSPDQWNLEIPEEIKHDLANRFITLLRRIKRSPQFSPSIKGFFQAMDDLRDEASRLFEENKSSITEVTSDNKVQEPLQTAYDEIKQLIKEFSGRSPDQIIKYIKEFFNKLQDNKELNSWRTDVRKLVNEVTQKPELLDENSLVKRIEGLFDRGRQVFNNSQLREAYNKLTNEFWTIFENIKEDPDVKNLNEKLQKFAECFTYTDEQGTHFNIDLMGQMRELIAPLLIKQLENIPMPTLEGSNESADWRIEHLTFKGSDIIPDHIQINLRSDIDFNVKKMATDKTYTRAWIKISNIHVELHDVHFWFKRKSIPRIEDEGIASLECAGDNANLEILLKISGGLEQPSFTVKKVNCDIDKINITIKESKHSFLTSIVSYFYENKWKRDIENGVEDSIKTVFNEIEKGLSNVFQKYPPKQLPSLIKEQISTMGNMLSSGDKSSEKMKSETMSDKGSPKTIRDTTTGQKRTSAH